MTTVLDVVDFNDGLTSLREAIFATDLVSGRDTIEFSPALTAGGPGHDFAHSRRAAHHGRSHHHRTPTRICSTSTPAATNPTPDIDDGKGSRVVHIDDGLATSIEVTFKGLSFTGGDVSGVGGGILA